MEKFLIGYRRLFKVEVLHRYFLDVGQTPYDFAPAVPSADELKKLAELRLVRANYDVKSFWAIQPTPATQLRLRNQRLIFAPLPDGFQVGVSVDPLGKPQIPLAEGLALTFAISLIDGFFPLYTELSLATMNSLAKGGQVAWLQNKAGTNLLNAGGTLGSVPDELKARDTAEATNAPVFGLVNIVHNPTLGLSLLDGGGQPETDQVFRIVLLNRVTVWQYQAASLGSFGLVQHGRIALSSGDKALPNPGPATTAYREADGKFYSTIY